MDSEEILKLKEYWRKFTIVTCPSIIRGSLKDMETETLSACWKNVHPEWVQEYDGISPEDIQFEVMNNAVTLAKEVGYGFDIMQDKVNHLIEAHSKTLTGEYLF